MSNVFDNWFWVGSLDSGFVVSCGDVDVVFHAWTGVCLGEGSAARGGDGIGGRRCRYVWCCGFGSGRGGGWIDGGGVLCQWL